MAPPSSCVLLFLFVSSLVWLLINLVFALIDSLKFHSPDFLAGIAPLTYGRVHAARESALLYGFGAQAALAVCIWLFTRLGKTPVVGQAVAVVGAALWNIAVTIGIVGILIGDATGYSGFEMPAYVSAVLLLAYVLIGICALLTFSARRNDEMYASQWFGLGSILWFPWIFCTAVAMLQCMPARGVVQSIVAWWFARNFSALFLGFAALASIFYFIPKLINRPLHSSYLGAF